MSLNQTINGKSFEEFLIEFQDCKYPIKSVYLPETGIVSISTNSLNNKLLNEDGAYFSDEARTIDEQIYFFVEDDQIDLPTKILQKLIYKESF